MPYYYFLYEYVIIFVFLSPFSIGGFQQFSWRLDLIVTNSVSSYLSKKILMLDSNQNGTFID